MFACYLTPEEFFAAHAVQNFIPVELCEQRIRNAALVVANDLRTRGVDTAGLMPPKMLVGSTLYEAVTKSSDYTGDSVQAAESSRLVVKVTSESFATFGLEGSKDETTWDAIHDVISGNSLALEVSGIGTFSSRYFEQYPYYRLKLDTDESITFTAYLVDDSVSQLIEWKTLEDGMFLVLNVENSTHQLSVASRKRYSELIASIKDEYD